MGGENINKQNIILLLICITVLFSISSVSATDMENETIAIDISQDINQNNEIKNENLVTDEPDLGASLDDDVLNTEYFETEEVSSGPYKLGDTVYIRVNGYVTYAREDSFYVYVDGAQYLQTTQSVATSSEGIPVTFNQVGTYSVKIFARGYYYDYDSSNSLTITIEKATEKTTSTVTVDKNIVKPDNVVIITPKVFNDETDEEIHEGKFEIYINGILNDTIDADKTLSFSSSVEGSYNIFIKYLSNDNYESSESNVVTFVVSSDDSVVPTSVSISFNTSVIQQGESILITPIVKNLNSNENIESGTIAIYDGNDNFIGNVDSGSNYVYSPDINESGEYWIYAKYLGDNDLKYYSSESPKVSFKIKCILNINLTVNGQTDATLSVASREYDYSLGNNVYKPKYIFYADCGGYSPVLEVYDNDELVYEIDDNVKGDSFDIILYFTDSEIGEHKIYVKFLGDDNYVESESNILNIQIISPDNKSSTSTTLTSNATYVNNNAWVSLTPVLSNGFTDGTFIISTSSSVDDAIGIISVGESFDYQVTGSKTIYAIYGGYYDDSTNTYYSSSYAYVELRIASGSNDISLTVNDAVDDEITIKPGDSVTFNFDLENYSGYYSVVYLYSGETQISSDSASSKSMKITFDESDLGINYYYVLYKGDYSYSACKSNIIIVKVLYPTIVTLDVNSTTPKVGETIKITPTIQYDDESVSEGDVLYAYGNGTNITTLPADTPLEISFDVEGSYTIIVTYLENDKYGSSSIETTIVASNGVVISPTETTLELNTTSIASGQSINITPYVINKLSNTEITEGIVKIYTGDGIEIGETTPNKPYTYAINDVAGIYYIYATYQKNDILNYDNSTSDKYSFRIKDKFDINLTVDGATEFTAQVYTSYSYSTGYTPKYIFYADCGDYSPLLKVYDIYNDIVTLVYDNNVHGNSQEITMYFESNEVGSHIVYVVFESNETHLESRSNNVTFKVLPNHNPSLSVVLNVSKPIEGNKFLVTPNATYDNVQLLGNISVYSDSSRQQEIATVPVGQSFEYVLSNTTGSYSYREFYLYLTYNGYVGEDAFYLPYNSSKSFTALRQNSLNLEINESIENITVNFGDSIVLNANIKYWSREYVSGEYHTNILIYSDENNIDELEWESDGWGNYNLKDYVLTFDEDSYVGTHTIYLNYTGYNYYNYAPAVSNKIQVTVLYATELTLSANTTAGLKVGDKIKITPSVKYGDVEVTEGYIQYAYDNGTNISKLAYNEDFIFECSEEKEFTITATYLQNDKFASSENKTSFTVGNALISTVTAVELNTSAIGVGDSILITVNVTTKTDNNPVSEGTVNVYDGEKLIKEGLEPNTSFEYTPGDVSEGSTYNINAVYVENDVYASSTSESKSYKVKSRLEITFTINGETDLIIATGTSIYGTAVCDGQSIVLSLHDNDDTYNNLNYLTNSEDAFSRVYDSNELGSHIIYVTFEGDDDYLPAASNVVTVKVLNSISTETVLNLNVTRAAVGESILITPVVRYGYYWSGYTYVTAGNVSLYADSSLTDEIATVNTGETYEYEVTSSTPSRIYARYNGAYDEENYYSSSTGYGSVTVLQLNSISLTADELTVVSGQSVELTAVLDYSYFDSYDTKYVYFYSDSTNLIGSQSKTGYSDNTYENVNFVLEYAFDEVGEYNITAVYKGDTKYASATSNIITVKVIESVKNTELSLAVSNSTIKVGETLTITPTVTDSDGNPVTSGNITYRYENGTVIETLDADTPLTLNSLTNGTYTITSTYNGIDGAYYPSDVKSVTVDVIKNNISLTITVSNATYPNKPTATVTSDVSGIYVVRINGKEYPIEITDTQYSLEIELPAGNDYEANVTFEQTDKYNEAFNKTTFSIAKGNVTLVFEIPETGIYGQSVELLAVISQTGAEGTVSYYDGETLIGTGKIGEVLTVSDLNATTHNIRAHFNGDDNYNESEVSKQISISRADIELTVIVDNFIYTSEVKGTVTSQVSGEYDLILDDVFIEKITLTANIPYEFSLGVLNVKNSYSVTVSIDESLNYNAASNTTYFNVTATGTELNISFTPENPVYMDEIIFKHNITEGATGSVEYWEGETKLGEADSNGEFKISSLASGKHTIVAYYINDTVNHPPTHKTIELFIKNATNDLKIIVDDTTYPNEAVINITSDIDGLYAVDINGTRLNITVNGGKGSNTTKLNAGTYNASVSFTHENYDSVTVSDVFTVAKGTNDLTVKVDSTTYPSDVTVKVTATVDGVYTVDINGTEVIVVVSGCEGSNTTKLDAGSYNATVNFTDSNYEYVSSGTVFEVSKATNTLGIEVSKDTQYPSDVTVKVTATVDGVYTVDINGTGVIVVVSGCEGSNTTKLDAGSYNATVNFTDSNYEFAQVSDLFTVSKGTNTVTVEVGDVTLPDEVTVKVTADVDGTYTVKFNGTDITVDVDVNGGEGTNTVTLPAGSYKTETEHDNTNYETTVNEDNFIVNKAVEPLTTTATVKLNVTEVISGHKILITPVVVDSEGNEVTVGRIALYDSMKGSYTEITYIGAGAAYEYEITYTPYQTQLLYIYATYMGGNDGDKTYLASERSSGAAVKIVFSNSISLKVNDSEEITVNIGDTIVFYPHANNYFSGDIITLYRDGDETAVTLNNNQDNEFVLDESYIGDNTFTVVYSGNSGYATCTSNTVVVHVIKPVFENTTLNLTSEIGENVVITPSVKLANGTVVDRGNVTYSYENGTEIAVLDLGENLTLTLPAGNYTINAVYNGVKNIYNQSTAQIKVNIYKKDVELSISVSDVVYGTAPVAVVTTNVEGNYIIIINGKREEKQLTAGENTIEWTLLNASYNYIANVTFDENDEYYSGFAETTFNVSRADISLSVQVDNAIYPNEVKGFITADVTGNYTVTSGDNSIEVKVTASNTPTEFSLGVLDVCDNYKVTVSIKETTNYNEASNTTSFNVTATGTELDVIFTPENPVYGDEIVFTHTLGEGSTGSVEYWEGETKLGEATGSEFKISNLTAGQHTLTVKYVNNTVNHPSTSKTVYVTVLNAVNDLKLIIEDVTYPGEVTVNLTATVNGVYVVDINGTEVSVNVVDGKGSNTVKLDAGTYDAAVKFTGENYEDAVANTTFTVSKGINTVTVEIDDVTLPDEVTVNVTANADGIYTVKINETTLNITVSNGEGSSTISLPEGNYRAEITYNNTNYETTANTLEFKVNPALEPLTTTVTVSVNTTVVVSGGMVEITPTVKDSNNNTVNKGRIFIYSDKKGYYSEIGIINAGESFNYTVDYSIHDSPIYFYAEYKGYEDEYYSSTRSAGIPVKILGKNTVSLTVNDTEEITVFVGETVGLYPVALNYYAGDSITLYKNNVSTGITLTNDDEYLLVMDETGDFNFNVAYNGNSGYINCTSNTIIVHVLAAEIRKTTLNLTYQTGENIVITPAVKLADDSIVTAGNVTYSYENGTEIAVLGLGENLTLTLPAGNYTINAVYNGVKNIYNQSTAQIKVNIYKKDFELSIAVSDVVYGTAPVAVVTTSVEGNYIIIINGKREEKQLTAGENIIEWTLLNASNNYVANVTFDENDEYYSGFAETTFNVSRADIPLTVQVDNAIYPNEVKGFITAGIVGNYTVTLGDNSISVKVTAPNTPTEFSLGILDVTDNYEVTVSIKESTNYNEASNTTSFNVTATGTELNILFTPENPVYGDEIVFTHTLSEGSTGSVEYWEGETKLGEATGSEFKISNLTAGQHTLTVKYVNDTVNHPSTSKTVYVTVLNATNDLKLIIGDVTYPDVVTVNITATVNGLYVVDINGTEVNVNVVGGKGSNTTKLDAGTYNASVKFTGENYEDVAANTTFTVSKGINTVTVEIDDVTLPDEVTVNVTANADGIYTVKINETALNITVVNGKGSNSISLPAGNYKVEITYNNPNYETSANDITFTVNKADEPLATTVTLEINVTEVIYGKSVLVTPVVKDSEGNIVKVGTVAVYNTQYYSYADPLFTLNAGESYNYTSALSAGNTEFLYAIYRGYNDEYLSSELSSGASFKILYSNIISLTVNCTDEITVYAGETVNLHPTAEHYYSGDAITLFKNNVSQGITLANDNDYALTLTESGTFIFKVVYSGNSGYISCTSNTVSVNVIDKDMAVTGLTLTSKDVKVTENIMITPAVKLTNNEEILEGNITYTYVNGSEIATLSVGENLTLSNLKAGEYTIVATYNGVLNKYSVSSSQIKVNVSKYDVELEITAKNITYGSISQVTVKTDTEGEYIIQINGKKYELTLTRGENTVSGDVLKASDEYIVNVTFNGNDIYNEAFARTAFTVAKADVVVSVTVPDTVYGDNIHGTVLGSVDGVYIVNNTVTVNVINGIGEFDLEVLNSGNYTVKVEFKGDINHNQALNSTAFTVSKRNSSITVSADPAIFNNTESTVLSYDLTSGAAGTVTFILDNSEVIAAVNTGETYTLANLEPGTYRISARYSGDNNFIESLSEAVTITVLKQKETPAFNLDLADNITVGDNIPLKVTLPEDAGGNITYIINNESVTLPVTQTLIINADTVGVNTIKATYNGNDKYTSNTVEKTFTVVNAPVIITAPDVVKYYGGFDKFNVNVDRNGNPLVNRDVLITVNSKNYTLKTDSAGSVSLDVNFDVGSYIAAVTVDDTTVRANIIVKSTVNTTDLVKDYGESTPFTVSFKNTDGTPLANSQVQLTVGGIDYEVTTNSEGIAQINPDLKIGTYAVSITNPINLEKAQAKIQILKNPKDTVLDVSSTSVFEDENATVTVKLPSDATGTVTIANRTVPLLNGSAVVEIANPGIGNHTLTLTYSGDDYYKPNSSDVTVEVLMRPEVIIKADNLEKYFKGSERFVVTVYDLENNVLANTRVSITINGVTYNRTTNASGMASMAINLNSGVYNVVLRVNNTLNTSQITVKSTVNGSDIVKLYRNATQYWATFLDNNGSYLANGTAVQFNINGVLYTRYINGNEGMAKININLAQGNYTITAVNTQTGEMATNNITVLPVIVDNNDLVKYYKNASQYVVRVIDGEGNAVGAGTQVTFNINGVVYTRTTNESGLAKININLQPGDYVITASYNGCSVSNTIKVLPVLSANDFVKKYGVKGAFEAKLVDGNGQNVGEGVSVSFNINGVLYNRLTNASGIAKLNINLQAGEYIITSSYNGSGISNKVTVEA